MLVRMRMKRPKLMSELDECCRTVICDEANMTFADVQLFLTNSACCVSSEMDCHGEVYSELSSYLLFI